MNKPMKGTVITISSAAILIAFGGGIAEVKNDIANKATKEDVQQLQYRFIAESSRADARYAKILDKLDKIDEATSRTYNCLADILSEKTVRFCK